MAKSPTSRSAVGSVASQPYRFLKDQRILEAPVIAREQGGSARPHRGRHRSERIGGLVAGALSTAAGEYVSVSSRPDTEQADLRLERRQLAADPQAEEAELTGIYERLVGVAL